MDELNLLFKKHKADLVVMGMRGSSSEYKLFGSVTISAIRGGIFPVLAIPSRAKFSPIHKILFACEHNYLSPKNRLTVLKDIAVQTKALVQILHIVKSELVSTGETPSKKTRQINFDYYLMKPLMSTSSWKRSMW